MNKGQKIKTLFIANRVFLSFIISVMHSGNLVKMFMLA